MFELLRILKHRSKAIAWVGGVGERMKHDCNETHTPEEDKKEKRKEVEPKVVVSQIPPVFLDNFVN